MKILLRVPPKHDGVSYHRIIAPHSRLQKDYDVQCAVCTDFDNITWGQLASFDIILFSRRIVNSGDEQEFFDKVRHGIRKNGGKVKIVVDCDDYWEVDQDSPLYDSYQKEGITESVKSHLALADHVITTHSRLAEEVGKINPNVAIVPNAIDNHDRQFQSGKSKSRKIRFGYTGGSTHLSDLGILRDHLKALPGKYPGKYEIVFCGAGNTAISKEMEQVLSVGGNFRKIPHRNVFEYGKLYRDIDVSIVPLRDTKFCSMKSNLKISEALATSTLPLASNVEPYVSDATNHGVATVEQDGWLDAMGDIIRNGINKDDLRRQRESWEREFSMATVNNKRFEFYQSIV